MKITTIPLYNGSTITSYTRDDDKYILEVRTDANGIITHNGIILATNPLREVAWPHGTLVQMLEKLENMQ